MPLSSGTAILTFFPELLFCKDTHREGFDIEKADALEVNEDDKDESDQDLKGNSTEIMSKQ